MSTVSYMETLIRSNLLVEEEDVLYLGPVEHKKGMLVKECLHRGQKRYQLLFKYDEKTIEIVKQIIDYRWSSTMKCWHIPFDELLLNELISKLGDKWQLEIIVKSKILSIDSQPVELPEELRKALTKYKRFLLNQRYSENTLENYLTSVRLFFEFLKFKSVEEITQEDFNQFNEQFIIGKGRSASSQNIYFSALKLFFKETLNKEFIIGELKRPRRDHRLPEIFSKEEVARIIGAPMNIKHRAMLATIYSCGLRCGDLIHMKLDDIDSERMIIHIKRGKGRKDRIVPLPVKLLVMLRDYYKICHPKVYVFEGVRKGEPYSDGTMRQIFKHALQKSGIKRYAKLHWLRHSYATHLLEGGTDIRFIQEILGHQSSRTTEIYTHVSIRNIHQIHNPFDDLDI